MLSDARRVAVIVTTGDPQTLAAMARGCQEAAASGSAVRVFFRDESIPAVCKAEVADRLLPQAAASEEQRAAVQALHELATAGDVRLYACSSSLYLWGVQSADLLPAMSGARGLIAFLAEDLAGASEAHTY